MLRVNNWSHVEDEAIIEVMLDYARRKETATAAFEFLHEIMPNRTVAAISFRWYHHVRAKVLGNPLYEEPTKELADEAPAAKLGLQDYVNLLSAPNLNVETLELINARIRSLL